MFKENKIKLIDYSDEQIIQNIEYINPSDIDKFLVVTDIEKELFFSGFGNTTVHRNVTEESIKKLESESKL